MEVQAYKSGGEEIVFDSSVLSMPKGISFNRQDERIVITRRWRGPIFIFLVFFTVIWNLFLTFFFGMLLKNGGGVFGLFGSLHAAVGIGLIYFVISGFTNKTTITAEAGRLTLKHGPLPWPGGGTFTLNDIAQLEIREQQSSNTQSTGVANLLLLLRNGGKRQLLPMLPSKQHAAYLQSLIEDVLYG